MPCSTSATGTITISMRISLRGAGPPASAGREERQATPERKSQHAAVLKYKSKSGISILSPRISTSLPIPHARRPDATPLLHRQDAARPVAAHRGKRAGDAARSAPGAPRRRRRIAGGEGLRRESEGEGARRGGGGEPHAGAGAGRRRP